MICRRAIVALCILLIAVAAPAADFTVAQKNRAFSVRRLVIKVGDRITFVNEDNVNHHVYSETKGAELDILQRPGRSDTVRFVQPGVVEVGCAIHPKMELEVEVRP